MQNFKARLEEFMEDWNMLIQNLKKFLNIKEISFLILSTKM